MMAFGGDQRLYLEDFPELLCLELVSVNFQSAW